MTHNSPDFVNVEQVMFKAAALSGRKRRRM